MIKNPSFQVIDPDRDTRALIYQQVEELEAFAKGLGTVVVRVEESRPHQNESKARFAATYILAPQKLDLEVRAESDSLNSALLEAKNEAKKVLPQVLNALAEEGFALHDADLPPSVILH